MDMTKIAWELYRIGRECTCLQFYVQYIFWIEFHFICVCYKPRLQPSIQIADQKVSHGYIRYILCISNFFPELHTIAPCETWLNFGQVSDVIIHPFALQDIGNIPFLHCKSLQPQSNSTVQCGMQSCHLFRRRSVGLELLNLQCIVMENHNDVNM